MRNNNSSAQPSLIDHINKVEALARQSDDVFAGSFGNRRNFNSTMAEDNRCAKHETGSYVTRLPKGCQITWAARFGDMLQTAGQRVALAPYSQITSWSSIRPLEDITLTNAPVDIEASSSHEGDSGGGYAEGDEMKPLMPRS